MTPQSRRKIWLVLLAAAPLVAMPMGSAEVAAPSQVQMNPEVAPPAAPERPAAPPAAEAAPIIKENPSSTRQSSQRDVPLSPSSEQRQTQAPRRFDASLDALERDRVISPNERVRVHRGLIGPMTPARKEACNRGALSSLECTPGVLVRGRNRQETPVTAGGDSDGNFAKGDQPTGNATFRTDALPPTPISVPVTALLSGAGGSFRLTDVFSRTPRPAAIAGNGNARLLFPLIGTAEETSPFGWRLHPVMGTWLMHSGRDLAAPEGTPVAAALNGRVVSSGLAGGYGLAIEIEHDGPKRRTLYGHLSELYVKEGQLVRQGEVIGRVGSTGLSTGPHLHFEVRMPQEGGWVAVDPGQLDPGSNPQPVVPGQLISTPNDAVAQLMGQLLQTLERPMSSASLPAPERSAGDPHKKPQRGDDTKDKPAIEFTQVNKSQAKNK